MAGKYYINRFPICALVYKVAAELMGYNKNEAKSLALARATFFAAAKNGFTGKSRSTRTYQAIKDSPLDVMRFAGLDTFIIYKDDEIRGYFGGQIMKPERYNSYVEGNIKARVGTQGLMALESYFKDKMKDWDTAQLNSNSVYQLYQRERDKVRTFDFIKNITMVAKAV